MKAAFCGAALQLLCGACLTFCQVSQPPAIPPTIIDVSTDKARYAPGEPVLFRIHLQSGEAAQWQNGELDLSVWHEGVEVSTQHAKVRPAGNASDSAITIRWLPPTVDFTGYWVKVRLLASDGKGLQDAETAVDVSSDWSRFPRYGYLAHYSTSEGVDPAMWIGALNEFHIDGLQFYDFQSRHERPLAGDVAHPADKWADIAGREVDRSIVNAFITGAHAHNMETMAYNASYSAYGDAFAAGSPVKLQWATWNDAHGPRTLAAAKSFDLHVGKEWKASRLVFMNQNLPAWQDYLFSRMADLFRVYDFDGWHIDAFGDLGGYAYDGTYVNYVQGFAPYLNHAKEALQKRVVLNTVNTLGQDLTACSDADFVYSELWENHETYASILDTADQVHRANPEKGLVIAAYLQRPADGQPRATLKNFNAPGVLLADATIFASGAAHIELGDDAHMLSSEYFPADSVFAITPELHNSLRHYYDFLTAYENLLRYRVFPSEASVVLRDLPASPYGLPDSIWTIAREANGKTVVHLINLLGSKAALWRDSEANRPDAPAQNHVNVRIYSDRPVAKASWASPDVDGGEMKPLAFHASQSGARHYVDLSLPTLHYWDMVVLTPQ
jgi:dextranase